MSEDKSLDIKAPGFDWKGTGVFVGVLLLLCLGIFGYFGYQKKQRMKAQERQKVVIRMESGIDEGFFNTIEEPEPTPPPKEDPPEPPPEKEPEPIVVELPPAVPAPKPPPPKPEDLFKIYHPKTPKKDRAAAINNRRRGAVEINVRVQNNLTEEVVIKEVQGKWKEEKTKASLPINMERVLTVDRFISAILVPEVHSELPGKVVAQVEQHVYGAHGRKILIPAGTKAIGRYKPLKKVGEERLNITWIRMITPDGINIHCGNAEMADSMGRSGITGEVDNRYFERYGMSLLVSAFTATTSYSVPVRNQSQQVVIESFGKEQSSLAKAILEENLEIKPKVAIPYGSRVLISPSKDIWFKKLGDNEVVVTPVEG